ncbi:hypothetical protein A0H81_02378 [Grifola frondosa]|uniref:Uncharacterized protein n=1 Tax=Grifola frondosa TaxID=5627 RepID=A0A1C7MKW6_GRIFR|nr:hypothetical protein A0H81_02378 [Grifola frondosa]
MDLRFDSRVLHPAMNYESLTSSLDCCVFDGMNNARGHNICYNPFSRRKRPSTLLSPIHSRFNILANRLRALREAQRLLS